MRIQNCLITGAGGFIGRHVSLSLARRGISVYALYRSNLPPVHKNIQPHQGDIQDPETWEKILPHRLDACIHLAALLPGPQFSAADYQKVNVLGTKNVLDVALAHQCRTFINTSSSSVSGFEKGQVQTEATPAAPRTPYHISKLEAEKLCDARRHDTSMRILTYRITSPYGVGMPYNSLLGIFLQNALNSRPFVIWGTGKRCQNFIHVQDVVRACHRGLRGEGDGTFLVAGKQSTSTTDLARIFIDISGKKDTPIIYEASKPEDSSWFFDASKAKDILGFESRISIAAGCRQLYAFLRKFPSGKHERAHS